MPNTTLYGLKSGPESTYNATKNFRKEYMHLCGSYSDIKDTEQQDIESYLYRSGIKEPTRQNIRDGIRICGYNNYHDVNALFSLITKAPLPPIAEYMDVCITRFEKYWNAFHILENKEGDNITNIHFLIKLFLWQESVPYENDWFRILSTQTEGKHRRNAKRICLMLQESDSERSWRYPPEWDV